MSVEYDLLFVQYLVPTKIDRYYSRTIIRKQALDTYTTRGLGVSRYLPKLYLSYFKEHFILKIIFFELIYLRNLTKRVLHLSVLTLKLQC